MLAINKLLDISNKSLFRRKSGQKILSETPKIAANENISGRTANDGTCSQRVGHASVHLSAKEKGRFTGC